MREINLDRLRTLLTVADLGSFAAAAKVLHLAPPTVTLHVAQLEERLGTRLLHRAPAGVTATSAGSLLIDKARQLLAEADDLLQTVQRQIATRGGRVRLGASTGALAHLLPQALETLAARHPEIDVQVAVMTSEEALARLAAGSLDIGIVAFHFDRCPTTVGFYASDLGVTTDEADALLGIGLETYIDSLIAGDLAIDFIDRPV